MRIGLARVLHLSSQALAKPRAAAEARPLASSIGLQRTSLCVVEEKKTNVRTTLSLYV